MDHCDQAQDLEDRERANLVERAQAELRSSGATVCDNCEEPIEPKRLAALPSARLCISCKTEQGRR